MKKKYITMMAAALLTITAAAQPAFEMSRNIYRVPYAGGTDVHVSNDHFNHNPPGRYDMSGEGNGSSCSGNYTIVAAAAGYVRRIVDNNNVHGPDCTENCSNYNNYVWIEHANGEWTKYSHMRYNSTTVSAGLTVGEFVNAGQMLGYECDIGQASGPHLHFEVRHPNNPANVQISTAGGFMSDADHRIPVFCGQIKNYMQSGDDFTSAACGACGAVVLTLSNTIFLAGSVYARLVLSSITTNGTVNFSATSSTMLQSSSLIVFSPGVTISSGSYFEARIGACTTTPY